MAEQKILITGGCGFFATWLLRHLLDDDDRPVVMDLSRNTKRWEMVLSPVEAAAVPLPARRIDDTGAFLALALAEKPDAIIHLAGLQVPTCRTDPLAGAKVNVIGTLNVFEAAKALKAAGHIVPRIV